jgi:hypothetical protein
MSEDLGHLTDEDFEAIERIVEAGLDRQYCEHILQMWQEGHKRPEQDAALLGLLSEAKRAEQEDAQE